MTGSIECHSAMEEVERPPLVDDELASVVSALCAKFPDRGGDEIAELVITVYRRLADHATVTAHLIPLTLNRCRRLLIDRAKVS